jgi:hypothetical protein
MAAAVNARPSAIIVETSRGAIPINDKVISIRPWARLFSPQESRNFQGTCRFGITVEYQARPVDLTYANNFDEMNFYHGVIAQKLPKSYWPQQANDLNERARDKDYELLVGAWREVLGAKV